MSELLSGPPGWMEHPPPVGAPARSKDGSSGGTLSDWAEYQRHVLAELERHNTVLEHLDEKLNEIRQQELAEIKVEIAMLKIKSGLWGAAAGMVPVLVALSLSLLHR